MRLRMQFDRSMTDTAGESWMWDSHGVRVAVDVGATKGLGRVAASFAPDMVVLTHDDSDHVGGVVEFLESANSNTRHRLEDFAHGDARISAPFAGGRASTP
jgi:glyoxylase-like metal-dependent hydrolase (beta-lactamase superfamily II)